MENGSDPRRASIATAPPIKIGSEVQRHGFFPPQALEMLLFDPQTSGGLLVAIGANCEAKFQRRACPARHPSQLYRPFRSERADPRVLTLSAGRRTPRTLAPFLTSLFPIPYSLLQECYCGRRTSNS